MPPRIHRLTSSYTNSLGFVLWTERAERLAAEARIAAKKAKAEAEEEEEDRASAEPESPTIPTEPLPQQTVRKRQSTAATES